MKLAKTAGLLALATLGNFAFAQESFPLGWYVGTSLGQSKATIDNERITNSLLGSGFASSTVTNDRRDLGFKVLGGYQMNKYLALEGGYFDLGNFGYTATTIPPGTLTGEAQIRGINLDLVGRLPVTDKFSVFARAGVTRAEARDTFRGTGAVVVNNPNPRERANNAKFGVGMEYAFTPALSGRAEIERYRINDAVGNTGDIDLVSVGVVYRFGVQGQRPVARAEAPAPVVAAAPAPLPAPVASPPPLPAPLMKVAFSADSLFDFNQSTVKPSGKQALDKFSTDLRGTKYDVVKVTGHTDRIGKHEYNMKLSSRRAEAVKSYLAGSAGIPAERISATGVNGADPVTKPGDCAGQKPTPKLIACLQPDRRVEVEVSGTR
jgi:OOP family OmpA-OmpF porin